MEALNTSLPTVREHIASLPALMAASFADKAVVTVFVDLSYHGYDGFAAVEWDIAVGPFPTEASAQEAVAEGIFAVARNYRRNF